MANRRMEFMIGMTVLVVFVTIIIMTILFGSNRTNLFQFKQQGQKMSILFDKAPGIKNTSRVTKSGIEIGRVYRSDLIDGKDGTQVRVYFTINDPKTRIFSNEQARIKPSLLMGEAEIEFVKNRNFNGEVREMTPSDVIVGYSGSDIMGTVNNIEGDLKNAIQSINTTAQEAARFIGNLNDFMGNEAEIQMKKEKIAAIFDELGDTLKTTRSLTTNLNTILSDPQIRENIQKGSTEFPNILNKVSDLLGHGDELYNSIQETVSRSHKTFDKIDRSLDNIGDFTEVLSDEGPEFISSINASGQDIAKMAKNISALSDNIVKQMDNKETPLGMLTDEEVGRELRGVVRNVETATEKVQPILDDARVFTNKIAHRPSSLIFSRDTYKGAPSLGGNGYAWQPLSPGGGMNSSLWTPSNAYYPSEPRFSSYVNGYGAYHAESLEDFQYSHPETYSALQREKPFGSCLGRSCLSKLSRKEETAEGYTTDPGVYYGMDGVVPVVEGAEYADACTGEYPAVMPVSGENEMTIPSSGCGKIRGCGMGFSLTSALQKVFKPNGKSGAKSCLTKRNGKSCFARRGEAAGDVYPPENWEESGLFVPGDWNTENAGWTPAYGSPVENPSIGGNCSVPSCEPPACEPSCEPLCGAQGGMSAPLPGSGYAPGESSLPNLSSGLAFPSEEMELTETPQNAPSALPPAKNEKSAEPPAQKDKGVEVLPPSAIPRPAQTEYVPSGMKPGYTNNAPAQTGLPAPVKSSKKRNFVDDGLPIRFTPND